MSIPSHSSTAEPAATLDRTALDRLRALQRPGRPSILRRIADLYLLSTPADLLILGKAVARRDLPAVHAVAHTLKSSTATLGALRLASLFGRLERMARDQSADGIDGLFAEIELAGAAAAIELTRLPELQGSERTT